MKWIKSLPWETEASGSSSLSVYHSGGLTLESWFDVVLRAKILETDSWLQIPALIFQPSVALGKLLNIFVLHFLYLEKWGNFPGGPMIKTSPSNARGTSSIPACRAKISHASQAQS